MGSLMGHVVPGSFFIFFALWWVINIFNSYYRCQSARRKGESARSFRNSVTHSCSCCPGRLGRSIPMEGIFKIVCVIVGIIGEVATGVKGGKFIYKGNIQHATMFFFFGLSGVIDVLLHYGIEIIPNLDSMALILAFSVEFLLFAFHLHGRAMVDVHLHQLLIIAIFGCVVLTLVEMRYRKHPGASLCRCYFTLLQGTWFYHVGFQLYPPAPWLDLKWDENGHDDMMMTTVSFTWHLAADFLAIVAIGLVTKLIHNGYSLRDEINMKSLTSNDENGHTHTKLLDSDNEVEEFDLTHYQRLNGDAVKEPRWAQP